MLSTNMVFKLCIFIKMSSGFNKIQYIQLFSYNVWAKLFDSFFCFPQRNVIFEL